jgi:hypothetical protein
MGQVAICRSRGTFWRRARALVHRLIVAVSDRYRPERHYMRGPGPKSHARRGSRIEDND